VIVFALLLLLSGPQWFPQQPFATGRCGACRGEQARGTAKGPDLTINPRGAEQSEEQLRAYPEHGNPGAGMPCFADPADALVSLAKYLRRISADTILVPVAASGSAGKIIWGAPH
jgi:hypothetical protein